jgi:hypothetical protein
MKKQKKENNMCGALNAGNYKGAGDILLEIPGNVRTNILRMLPIRDIINVFQVNAALNEWSKSEPGIWLMIFKRNFKKVITVDVLQSIIPILLHHRNKTPLDLSHNNYQCITFAYGAILWFFNQLARDENRFLCISHFSGNNFVFRSKNFSEIIIAGVHAPAGVALDSDGEFVVRLYSHVKRKPNVDPDSGITFLSAQFNMGGHHILFYGFFMMLYYLLTHGWTVDPIALRRYIT